MNRNSMLVLFGGIVLVALAALLAFVIQDTCITCVSDDTASCFRAAVLDHVQQQLNSTTKNDRHENIELNLQMYEDAARLAKENGADIIVYPENGIIFGINDRSETIKYSENIPATKVALCTDTFRKTHPITRRLACIAKENKIFLAADLVDKQNHENGTTNLYNTAILLDRDGVILAKYHKIHLFGEMTLNVPPTDELVVVNTEIGRLSMQICFDMIYEKPGVALAAKNAFDTMLFPTWWFDELPFLAASQYQTSWAFVNEVNLLASNIHQIKVGSKGSGIYAGAQQEFAVINNVDSNTRLLVASLPVNTKSNAQCQLNPKTIEVPQKVPVNNTKIYFYQRMNLSQTKMIKLNHDKEFIKECYKGVCCSLDYKIENTRIQAYEEFYLIITNRTRPGAYPWTEEFCALVHCFQLANTVDSCTMIGPDSPKFTYVQLSGEFSVDTMVYPSVIGSEHQVMPKTDGPWDYESILLNDKQQQVVLIFGDKNQTKTTGAWSLSTIGLYGRVYSRDPPYHQQLIQQKQ